jgi:hypothetical protein
MILYIHETLDLPLEDIEVLALDVHGMYILDLSDLIHVLNYIFIHMSTFKL